MKKRIGITQRVVYKEDIDERWDVLDQQWYCFADELAVQLIPIPNVLSSVVEYVTSLNIKGIIFSGGNNIGISGRQLLTSKNIQDHDVAMERDQTEMCLLEWAEETQTPVVGVCRGFQFINAFYGGEQSTVDPEKHVANSHYVDIEAHDWQSSFGSSMSVNSFHNWGVLKNDLADNLQSTVTYGAYVEGFQHQTSNQFGIMWHPERYKEFRNRDITFFKQIFR